MFKFSIRSIQLLNTADKRLGILANEVLKVSKIDFGITDGWRSQEKHSRYFWLINIIYTAVFSTCVFIINKIWR